MHTAPKNKWMWILVLFIILIFIFKNTKTMNTVKNQIIDSYSNINTEKHSNFIANKKKVNWITIEYGGLVDFNTITHNEETIGQIIKKIPTHTDDMKGLIQEYLEPYSILCHDIIISLSPADTLSLINILDCKFQLKTLPFLR
ncbi:hypothetical protein HNV12_19230 [Methanococcoides sp. SA1]|nr:hypothetical protein [Methanococcoides sp. SA1]